MTDCDCDCCFPLVLLCVASRAFRLRWARGWLGCMKRSRVAHMFTGCQLKCARVSQAEGGIQEVTLSLSKVLSS